MKVPNHILSALFICFFLAACGKPATNEDQNTVKTQSTIMQDNAIAVKKDQAELANELTDGVDKLKSEVSALSERTVSTFTEVKEQKMTDLKSKLKNPFTDWQQGRVQYINIEGGFYGIITDTGMKILPMNLNEKFASDGAIVRIKGDVKKVLTTQQWGTPFTITNIELVKSGNKIKMSDM